MPTCPLPFLYMRNTFLVVLTDYMKKAEIEFS